MEEHDTYMSDSIAIKALRAIAVIQTVETITIFSLRDERVRTMT